MGQVNQKWDKMLQLFYEYPQKSFTVREIAQKTKTPSSSVQRYLVSLKRMQLITKENQLEQSSYVRFLKMGFFVERLYLSGLLDFLEKEFAPSCIILFGSIRKGEYDAESDIDLFLASVHVKDVDLHLYEKKLGHKIQLFLEKDVKDLPVRLRNNVLNGIKLGGYFTI